MDSYDYSRSKERAQKAADDIVDSVKSAGKELDNIIRDYRDTSISKIKVDLLEDEENYYIKADIPGASKDSVNVTIEEQNVIITCEFQSFEDELKEIAADIAKEEDKKEEDEEKELKYLIQGRITGKAKRIIPLSKKIKTRGIKTPSKAPKKVNVAYLIMCDFIPLAYRQNQVTNKEFL